MIILTNFFVTAMWKLRKFTLTLFCRIFREINGESYLQMKWLISWCDEIFFVRLYFLIYFSRKFRENHEFTILRITMLYAFFKKVSSSAHCGNYRNLLSHYFSRNFVKVPFLLSNLQNKRFDETLFGLDWNLIISALQNFREITFCVFQEIWEWCHILFPKNLILPKFFVKLAKFSLI